MKPATRRIVCFCALALLAWVPVFGQETATLPSEFSSQIIVGGKATIAQFVAVLQGTKSFEIDGKKLIIRTKEADKLLHTEKSASYLLERLSDTPEGAVIALAGEPGLGDIYRVTRIVIDGDEQSKNKVNAFNQELLIKIGLAFPDSFAADKPTGWAPVSDDLNTDLNPDLVVYSCTGCHKISKTKETTCKNCGNPMGYVKGYVCPSCGKFQLKYNEGKCTGCTHYFLSVPEKPTKQVKVYGPSGHGSGSIDPALNVDLHPGLQVYTCTGCEKVVPSVNCSNSPTCQFVKRKPGYYCQMCKRSQQAFNNGLCEKCERRLVGVR